MIVKWILQKIVMKKIVHFVEIVLLIVLKLCYVVLGHSEVGEKLQRVACRSEVVDRNFVEEI